MADNNVFVYYWKAEEIKEPNNYHTEIRMFGVNELDENVCIRVDDFKTRMIIEFIDVDFLLKNIEKIKADMSAFIFNRSDKNSLKLVYKKKLYGCNLDSDQNEKLTPFIQVHFSSRIGMHGFKNKINNELGYNVKYHEMSSDSSELQFMVEQKLDASGWLTIRKSYELDDQDKISKAKKEYLVSKRQVVPCDKKESVNVKIMAWDIEAECKDIGKNPGGEADDCVFQISCVFFETNHKTVKKVLLTLGKCRQYDDDVEIRTFKCEKDLILGFTDIIIEHQPNILTGWNIFNFDITFMINRAEHNMCLGEFLSFGLIIDSPDEIKTLKWTSKAFSTTDIKYIESVGILFVDLIDVVRKEYKLDSYSLNNVCKHFLKEVKDDISFQDLKYAYSCYLKNSENLEEEFTKVGKYCVQDSKLVVDLFDKLQTWLSLSEMSKTTSTTIMCVHLNGQQKKFYNQVYRYCYFNNIVVQSDSYKSLDSDKYMGAYVFDPVPGLYNYVVPLDFASLYPSIIIAYNLDYTTIVDERIGLPEETLTCMEWEDHNGCEHDPLIIKKNTLTSLIENCNDSKKKSQFVKARAEVVKKINKTKICQKNKFKFLKQEVYGKGVLPTIIQGLLDARKEVRREMKTISDPSILAILNQRQLSYKISANSMYGATGVRSGALPFMPIAMCVTYTGRISIQNAASTLKNLGGTIVYGDTDSNYVMFESVEGTHEEKCEKIWNTATEVAEKISLHFPKPMKIEFEEVIYYKFMILTKKRYMYYSCDKKGNVSKKIGQKGVLLARRDNSKFLKQVYEESVMSIFDNKSKEEVLDNIFKQIFTLVNRTINTDNLTITKSVNDYNNCEIRFDEKLNKYYMGNYVVPKPPEDLDEESQLKFCMSRLPAQVQLELKMINRGQEKSEGSRLQYIVTEKPGATKQGDKIEEYKYFKENSDVLKIDTDYYITHLYEPLDQIFTSIYKTNKYLENSAKQFVLKSKQVNEIKKLFYPEFFCINR